MRLFLLAGLLATCAGSANGQLREDSPRFEGFWIGFGLGGGLNLDAQDDRQGGAGYLRMGGTINQMLVIGGEVEAWVREVAGGTVSHTNLTGTAYLYPSRRHGIFFKSGIGFAAAQLSVTQGNTTSTTSNEGFGATFGAGYDFRVGSNFFITPNVDLLVQVIEDSSISLLLFTVGVGWH